MVKRFYKWLYQAYPQNYILRKPYVGTLIFLAFCFGFAVLYKPLKMHESRFFNYDLTMAAYCLASSLPLIILVKIINKIRYFSKEKAWTILKELLATGIVLLGMGIFVYFIGFLFESPAQRWNLFTFFDSCKHVFLVGIIPFAFFTLINYPYLFSVQIVQGIGTGTDPSTTVQAEELIQIGSQLKKEELSFYPNQFIYAESDGNYVVFYLKGDHQIRKEIIRNSISNIEQQLSAIPFFMRTHRAFIINIKEVLSKKGNSLGYHLKLSGIEAEIPVSRQNTQNFNQLLKQYR
ncbi:MAG: LytTR family DNA-binding domain-containing protein [Bacteroidota bacterium]|nr:LytTR family DNA-binding domain-containing protein [Bacteroidota bacterium]